MFVQRTNGTITMMFAARQPGIAEEELADNHPDVLAFLNKPSADISNSDNVPKVYKALLLAAATMSGRTPAQAKAAFKAAWDALP